MKTLARLASAAGLAVLSSTFHVAHAASISIDFNQEFSGGSDPAGSGPWINATFDDGGVAGSVQLTMTANLSAGEFISGIYFNLDPALDPAALGFAYNGGLSTGPAASGITQSVDCCKADGDGRYDFQFAFSPSGNTFDGAEVVVYDITLAGITANSFDYLSAPAGGHGPFTAAAHVQGIDNDPDSGWIAPNPIPVPAAVWLFGSGLVGLVGLARRRRS